MSSFSMALLHGWMPNKLQHFPRVVFIYLYISYFTSAESDVGPCTMTAARLLPSLDKFINRLEISTFATLKNANENEDICLCLFLHSYLTDTM